MVPIINESTGLNNIKLSSSIYALHKTKFVGMVYQLLVVQFSSVFYELFKIALCVTLKFSVYVLVLTRLKHEKVVWEWKNYSPKQRVEQHEVLLK